MVKRVGNLIQRIAGIDNLQEAFLRASRGKCGDSAVIEFRKNIDNNLLQLHKDFVECRYHIGKYHFFTVFDPKERTICAASFRDRVAFHAMMRICHPVFDNYQVFDSYASRLGKGTYKALERAREFARKYRWFVKFDVCKYFDSIDHNVLLSQLCRLFKDKRLLVYFRDIIDSYETSQGRGLPIGNLTSQYFANHYLSVADHYAKECLRLPAIVRYMDDILFFGNEKEELKRNAALYVSFIENELRLELHPLVVNDTSRGLPFLGYVVYPSCLRLNGRSKKRFRTKMGKLKDDLVADVITQEEYANRAQCLFAFANKAEASDFIYKTSKMKGIYP